MLLCGWRDSGSCSLNEQAVICFCTFFNSFREIMLRSLRFVCECDIFQLSIIRRKMHHDDSAVNKAAAAGQIEKGMRQTTGKTRT